MLSLISKVIFAIWLLATLSFADSYYEPMVDIIPAAESNLNSNVEFLAKDTGLDSPHVTPINASTYDWWYFDVVSDDQGYNVVVTFFAAPGSAFAFSGAPATDITEAYLFVSTPENPIYIAEPILATKALIVSVGNGASGVWEGSGFSFAGTPDMAEYKVTINSPQIGIKGEIKMKSSASAHYPCGPVKAGQTMAIMPHVGWANAIPDAVAQVELDVNGTNIKFSGRGYHDKNWGDKPFDEAVATWYWGHGHLGPYSIVWYDALTPTNMEYVSAFVSRDGKIITGSCALSSITVRPTGPTDKYPPSSSNPASGNLHAEIYLGAEGTLAFDVTAKYHVVDAGGLYERWTGSLTGGIKGKKIYKGTALYEQFTFLP